jgi:hypothetical protein
VLNPRNPDAEGREDNEVQWIRGEGQMVYWSQCSVTVIEANIYTPLELRNVQGRLWAGTTLCMFGGKVKVSIN